MSKIVFNVPSKDAPGFAKRQRRVLELKRLKLDDPSPETIDQLVDFLAYYVEADNHEQAVGLMWEASENQWDEMLNALGGASSEIPPPKSETSESQ